MPKLPDEAYWRYKKSLAPVDDNAHLNGEVKVTKPAITLPIPVIKKVVDK